MNNRRSFLQQTAALAGGAILMPSFNKFNKNFSAADKINIGAIGINGMGWADLVAALKVRVSSRTLVTWIRMYLKKNGTVSKNELMPPSKSVW